MIIAPDVGETAIAKARTQSAQGPRFGANQCLMRVRFAFGVTTIIHDAAASWQASAHKHRVTDPNAIPRGVPVYWLGGSGSHGHVAIATGDGACWSTDIRRPGFFDKVPITEVHAKWGLTLVGWTDDINGVLVHSTPPVPATTYGVDASHFQFDNGLNVDTVASEGYDFTILKCTQGVSWFDKTYPAALSKAAKAGQLVAAYHFLEHGNPTRQAANLAAHIIDRSVPVVIDCEPSKGSRPTMADVVAFRDAATTLGLRVTMKYLPRWYWLQLGKPNLDGPLKLWASAYPSNKHDHGSALYPGNTDAHWSAYGGQTPALWQFTSTGKLDGYSGDVDMNAFRGTRAELAATRLFKDYGAIQPPKPPKPPVQMTTHTHLQLNVQRTMSRAQITADLTKAYGLGADTIVFNEIETDWHRTELARLAITFGYHVFMPTTPAAGAIVVAAKNTTGTIVYEKSVLCAPGMKGLSPSRYYNRIQLLRADTGERLSVGGTQMWSSGWTGSTSNDALRKAHWYAHMAVMAPAFRGTTKGTHVSIGSGDLNRPPGTFANGKVLGKLIDPKGMTSVGYAQTDSTHGSTTFDYVWWASTHTSVTVKSWATPAFNSDHDGVLTTLTWPTSTVALP